MRVLVLLKRGELMDKIGVKIKEIRIKHKDTLKSLADKIDYDWSNLSKVERGIYTVSIEILEKIAKVYNIDVSYFFTSEEDESIFSEHERSLLYERDLSVENIKRKYKLIDEIQPSDEEIKIMADYIKALRIMAKNESS
jgi:transcriptional regulator with XRE-family HTH domain